LVDDFHMDQVAAVRRFNRFYTRRIGVLHEGLLDSPYSLAEVRVLYELAHRKGVAARDLARDLGLDAGYLSRILKAFERRGLVRREPVAGDARRRVLSLTALGRRAFAPLDRRSQEEVGAMLAPLTDPARARLTGAMEAIERLLEPPAQPSAAFVLRTHRPGDMGWVTQVHGELYFREYGWDERFEALVAHIAAEFIDKFDPQHERCWIAERDGERVGSVFLVRKSARVAKLRLLIVDPRARGAGLGRTLVAECIRFARECGYRTLTLWTQQNLAAARRIYQAAGFELAASEPHAMFGVPLVGETWDLAVQRSRA
jgi:DNA-binding MarR family transcriptional regulator/N-acetylglutamate synthase-like GNAT family acetyltransferase